MQLRQMLSGLSAGDTEPAIHEHSGLFATTVLLCVVGTSFAFQKMVTSRSLGWTRWVMSESGLVLLLGMLAGLGLRMSDRLQEFSALRPEVFFQVLLPPIIFYAGYSLEKQHGTVFFHNLGTITVYAFVGTAIATLVTAGIVYGVASSRMCEGRCELTLAESFLFGAIVSAIDPVATIAVFERVPVGPSLFALCFGEAVLNDAVAIVLYDTVLPFAEEGQQLTVGNAFGAIGSFLGVSTASLAMGVGFGAVGSLTLKHAGIKERPELEVLVLLALAFVSYFVADVAHMSGIMSVMFYGVVMGHYAYFNLSAEGREASLFVSKVLGYTAELYVFAFIGMSVFTMEKHVWRFNFIALALLACLLARACNIFGLTPLINRGRKRKITRNVQLVMWYSGLRGAIAFALALDTKSPNAYLIETTTLGIVIVTTLCFGGPTLAVLHAVGAVHQATRASASDESDENTSKMWFNRLDRRYFKPWLRERGEWKTRHGMQGASGQNVSPDAVTIELNSGENMTQGNGAGMLGQSSLVAAGDDLSEVELAAAGTRSHVPLDD